MKNLIILLVFICFTFSCSTKKDCGDIVQKFTLDGKHYFALSAFGGDENSGDIYGDVEVSQEIFESFNIGEEYCIKQLE